jgi:hypothetical protein
MHKMTFMALSIMLGASACKQSPEATHGVDTTLIEREGYHHRDHTKQRR